MDNEIFILNTVKAKRRIVDLYRQTSGNCYLSFSGGKDSTVVLALIKLCEEDGDIPKNSIPAIYCDTRIELQAILDFVNWVSDNWYGNVQIIKPEISFNDVIKNKGKPAISKAKAELIKRWQKDNNMKSAQCLISNDNSGKYKSTRLSNKCFHFLHPDFKIKISNDCCQELKKKPFKKISKKFNGYLNGLRICEGGARELSIKSRDNICTKIKGNFIEKSPIVDWDNETIEEFIKEYDVPLSKAYTEYKLERTGCFLCPFSRDVKGNLEVLYKFEPQHYKASMYWLKDVYIAQGVELPFDEEYEKERKEIWQTQYDKMRYEMLKKYRPDCNLVKKYENKTTVLS